MNRILIMWLLPLAGLAQSFSADEISRWQQQARQVTITRDTWGIPHISGKTDADAVFGMLYAQCEADFPRIERNYLTATARLAEAEGENFIYNDLRMRLFMDTTKAITVYKTAPEWLQKICNAFADGINFYLYTHPETKPKLIKRFQPWMPFLFSEGSIGGDIESVSLTELKEFYGKLPIAIKQEASDDGMGMPEPKGSNGFAIAPSKSASGNPLLLINPHTSFYFRCELQMSSDEGLNAYGASTWGQFFIYQGFNEHCGWMHTTTGADAVDEYAETIVKKGAKAFYKYGKELKPLLPEKVSIAYKTASGLSRREFQVYRTIHGPVIAQRGDKWISIKMMQEPLKALTQSYMRTKARTFDDFKKTMDLRTNSSNNTVYADDQGNIAYWHGNFIPVRDSKFDSSIPLDGSNPATEWKGLHTVDESVHIYNPGNGWIQNCNSTPFTAASSSSPDKSAYPVYMAPDAENARGIHAVRVLKDEKDFTIDKLITVAHDSYLPGFEKLLPALIKAYDDVAAANDTLRTKYAGPIELLRNWDLRFGVSSVPTTLAIFWAQRLRQDVSAKIPSRLDQLATIDFLETQTSNREKTKALAGMVAELTRDFGSWKQPWGGINRFQRLTGKIESIFDDTKPSIAVPFTSSYWGSLAAYGSRRFEGTKKMYGYVGNSFVAAVEFGKKVKAKAVVTGGSSSDPASPHFNDQTILYCQGIFKDVWFYKEDYLRHVERQYHPGE
ncbi:MAG: penicillin acylase family protein [Cyclobacteriaceae bacterium]|nr:penicillin acylase family protein [Cyclobacteriaceae bacterium]